MKLKSIILSLSAIVSLAFPAFGAVLISIDITGANDPVDSASSRTWNFTVIQTIVVSRSAFSVKAGSQTSLPLVFTLYNNYGGTGTAIASSSLSAVSAGSSYDPPSIMDFTDMTLNPGAYSATLTSQTGTNGSLQYFIKNGALRLYNDDGTSAPVINLSTQLSTNFYTPDANNTGTATTTPTAVPEPSSLCALALTGLLALRRRRV
ncbi:MAG: hypothetical protein RL117_1723 [Verrucomicrobiota bacterium]|jgi:hypothetical protein